MRCQKCAENGDNVTMHFHVVYGSGPTTSISYQDSNGHTHLHEERRSWNIYKCPLDGSHDIKERVKAVCWCGWEQSDGPLA